MNTHTSYFTFSVAEVVQAVKRGWGEGEGRVGSSQGIGPDGTGQELLTAEKVLWGSGGISPLWGCTFQEGSKAGQEGRGRRVFPPCQSPWWEGDFLQKKISSGFGQETQLAPGD